MTVAAISCIRNEEDLIELNVRHLLQQGIDQIVILDHSDDATPEILTGLAEETGRVTVRGDHRDALEYDQDIWLNELAAIAANDHGAEWIVPFDGDEFWLAPGSTLKETLEASPERKLYATLYDHLDWNQKVITPLLLPKVAFRYTPTAWLETGSHEVNIGDGVWGRLEIRHLQYQNFEHFCAKVQDVAPRVPQSVRLRGQSTHVTEKEHWSEEQMRAHWDERQARATVHDPIPIDMRTCSANDTTP